jgi:hypothetical protein
LVAYGPAFAAVTVEIDPSIIPLKKSVPDNRVGGRAVDCHHLPMQKEKKGFLWEHEFRQFILKTVQHYNLAKPLAALKREIEQSGAKWPEEAFAAPKATGFRASIANAALRSGI